MLLKQMKYFITVVDLHSFTEAAEQCFISQSAISQQIKALEKELGVRLFERSKRQFSLTAAGEYFYRHGKVLLDEIEDFKEETIRRGEDQELNLTIGYPKNFSTNELLETIQAYKEQCVGMAANMIGYLKTMMVVLDENKYLILINPVILKINGRTYQTEEGCLSLQGVRKTQRYESIKVSYLDQNFKKKIRTFKGYTAQIIQHELDHFEGKII